MEQQGNIDGCERPVAPAAVVLAPMELDLATRTPFAAAILALDPRTDLTIDLRDNSFVDSSGLTVLIQAQQHFGRGGGRVVLANVSRQAAFVLEITGLTDSFVVAGFDD